MAIKARFGARMAEASVVERHGQHGVPKLDEDVLLFSMVPLDPVRRVIGLQEHRVGLASVTSGCAPPWKRLIARMAGLRNDAGCLC